MAKNYSKTKLFSVGKQFWILCLCSMLAINSFAQNAKNISGKVVDENKQPLPGVTVRVKGTKIGASTDSDGLYRIAAQPGDVLVFSMLGSLPKEITVANGNTIDAVLMADNKNLKDVVVIGYGTASKKDLTGAVTSIKSEEFNQGNLVSPAQLLQGKVSGLNVTKSGDPNAKPSTILRGPSTLREGAAQ